jgi:predicted aspartyl protease
LSSRRESSRSWKSSLSRGVRFKAFGGYVERDLGEVGIELMGRRRTITVIFGETDDTTVLGVTALESFGLEVDPVRGTLKEAELLMLTFQPLFVTPRNQYH